MTRGYNTTAKGQESGYVHSKGIEGKVQHQLVEIHNGALVSGLAQVLDDLVSLVHKHFRDVLLECLDGEDVARQLALVPPLRAIDLEDAYSAYEERKERKDRSARQ